MKCCQAGSPVVRRLRPNCAQRTAGEGGADSSSWQRQVQVDLPTSSATLTIEMRPAQPLEIVSKIVPPAPPQATA
jgi:hypothetical protein